MLDVDVSTSRATARGAAAAATSSHKPRSQSASANLGAVGSCTALNSRSGQLHMRCMQRAMARKHVQAESDDAFRNDETASRSKEPGYACRPVCPGLRRY